MRAPIKPAPKPKIARSTPEAAMNSPTTHVLMEGGGYFRMSALPMPKTGAPNLCDPPVQTADRSSHLLQSPQGPTQSFVWHTNQRAWMAFDTRARRIGFLAEYLSRHGWKYLRAAA